MSCLLLFLSSFVLDLSPVDLFFAPLLSSFVPLSNNQLGIDNFFVLFLLALHNFEFSFLKNFHSSLLEGFTAKNIEHRLHFFVEVEKVVVSFKNLGCFAAILRWHFWSEERYWRPIQIELCGNTLFSFWRLIS
jgi:hypothetical protein